MEMLRFLVALLGLMSMAAPAAAQIEVSITYLERRVAQPPTLSNLDPRPGDLGAAGAALGLADNNTTGKFLKQSYTLEHVVVGEDEAFLPAAEAILAGGARLIVVDAPATELLALADLQSAQDAVIFNAGGPDTALRSADCRGNLLHTLPSRAMLADSLAQFMVKRRWTDWALIAGEHAGDRAFADAIRAAAAKFGAEIVGEKTWRFDADMRRNAAQEVPPFTQELEDHDVLMVADELGDFARYIPFNTWQPRPVGGSEGLTATAWAPVVEQWGAAQLQSRFREAAGRSMRALDYAAWVAVRSIGEAVTRTKQADPAKLRAYLLSDSFQLAGFKGRKLSYRAWNGQLRQPIPLVHPRALTALAPIEGFLHEHSEMDTLGLDRGDSECTAFVR